MDLNKIYYAHATKLSDYSYPIIGAADKYEIVLVYKKDKCKFINLKTKEIYDTSILENGLESKIILPTTKVCFKNLIINKDKLTLKQILDIDSKLDKKSVAGKISICLKSQEKKIEETFAIIKPDGLENATSIIEMIYNAGLKIKQYEIKQLDEDLLKEHYAHIIDKPFYPALENYMLSKPVIIMVLEGEDAVKKYRDLMGPTDSRKADKGTIRGEFGTDITKNAVHGSDSKENAVIEINRFFKNKQKIK